MLRFGGGRSSGSAPGGGGGGGIPGTPDVAVVEPVLNPPSFWIDLPYYNGSTLDVQTGDVLRIQRTLSTDTGFSSVVQETTHTLTSPNLASAIDEPIDASGFADLDAGNYIARIRLERGVSNGSWSAATDAFAVPAATDPITFGSVTHAENTGNLSTYTFTNAAPLSATDGDWLVCIGFRGGAPPAINSVTAKGQACTVRGVHNSSTNKVAIYSVHLTAAAAGDIVVTLAAAVDRCGIGVVEIVGAGSLVPTDTDQVSGTDPATVTLTVPVNGAAIGLVLAPTATSYTWTGMTEAFDVDIESGVIFSMATLVTEPGGNIVMSADAATSPLNQVALFLAWGP